MFFLFFKDIPVGQYPTTTPGKKSHFVKVSACYFNPGKCNVMIKSSKMNDDDSFLLCS